MSETTIADTSTISSTKLETTITEATKQPVTRQEREEVTTDGIIHAKLENFEHENEFIGSANKDIEQFTSTSSSLDPDFTAGLYFRN